MLGHLSSLLYHSLASVTSANLHNLLSYIFWIWNKMYGNSPAKLSKKSDLEYEHFHLWWMFLLIISLWVERESTHIFDIHSFYTDVVNSCSKSILQSIVLSSLHFLSLVHVVIYWQSLIILEAKFRKSWRSS